MSEAATFGEVRSGNVLGEKGCLRGVEVDWWERRMSDKENESPVLRARRGGAARQRRESHL